MENNPDATSDAVDSTGAYMGVVDGNTPFGDIIGAGPEQDFPTPPKVAADPDRRSLSTPQSSSLNWMSEAIGAARIYGEYGLTDPSSQVYNAELVKQLTPEMQEKLARLGTPTR